MRYCGSDTGCYGRRVNSRREAIAQLRRIATQPGRATLDDLRREVDAIWELLLDQAQTLDDRSE